MTIEEAIKELERAFDVLDHSCHMDNRRKEAFNMAMAALEQEPCREAYDYENEIADLHNRLDIAEYDKERLREEVTKLESENKTLQIKLENAEDVLRGLKEDLADARAELREGGWND